MSGIYLHIPFCKKACHYCNFHFSTSMRYANDMITAIRQEIRLRKQDAKVPVETIYFGGGTPSVLSPTQLRLLLDEVNSSFSVVADPEITLEANPDDLSPEYINDLQKLGFNRLSIGVQSFLDDELTLMNRAHNGTQALSSV